VRAQVGVDLDYIIVDGGSADGTIALIKAESSAPGTRISRWLSERDDGIYDALNKGVALARGDVVGFLHADDMLADEEALKRVASCFDDPTVLACYSDLVYVDRYQPTKVIRHWKAGPFSRERLAFGWMPPHPTLYIRRHWYSTQGGFDTRYKIAADYELSLRLLKKHTGTIVYLPEVLVRMRLGGLSNRSLGNIVRKSAEDYRALRDNKVGGLSTLILKNLRKLPQFFLRPTPSASGAAK
jgi:glycosyltransferase involved in cell wall biosynthesis